MVLSGPPPEPVTTRASRTTGEAIRRSGGSASAACVAVGNAGCKRVSSAMATGARGVRVGDGGSRGGARGCENLVQQRLQAVLPVVVLLDEPAAGRAQFAAAGRVGEQPADGIDPLGGRRGREQVTAGLCP